jgi:PAS domain-containing protein
VTWSSVVIIEVVGAGRHGLMVGAASRSTQRCSSPDRAGVRSGLMGRNTTARRRRIPRAMRAAFESVHCPVVVVQPIVGAAGQVIDGRIVFVNGAAVAQLPHRADSAFVSEVFSDPLGSLVRLVADSWVLSGRHQATLEGFTGSLQVLAERDGGFVVLTVLDRAETYEAVQRMEQSEARFRDIVQQLQVSLTLLEPVVDVDGDLVDAMVRFRNARADADRPGTVLVNRLVSDTYLSPDDFLAVLAEAWATGRTVNTSIRNDGTERMSSLRPDYIETTVARIGDLLVEISDDRSDERSHLEELERSERLYRAIADEVRQPLHINRPIFDDDDELVDFEVVYANHAAEAARRRADSLVGMRTSAVIADWASGDALRAGRRAMLRGGDPVDVDARVIGDDGDSFAVRLQLRRMGDHMVSFLMPPGP